MTSSALRLLLLLIGSGLNALVAEAWLLLMMLTGWGFKTAGGNPELLLIGVAGRVKPPINCGWKLTLTGGLTPPFVDAGLLMLTG